MTTEGWVQIALFSVIVILITRPLGGYMTKVFAGERTFLSPVLRPVERAVYWCCGVDESEEQLMSKVQAQQEKEIELDQREEDLSVREGRLDASMSGVLQIGR